MRYTYWCEWDIGILDKYWDNRDEMIADLRSAHEYLFEGDLNYESFDKCVEQGLYTFIEVSCTLSYL